MNVAGLKGDSLPQLFHLHAVRRFVEDLVKPVSRQDAEIIKGRAVSSFLENNLNEDDILNLFKMELPTLTRETINQESISEENIFEFLMDKVAELHESGAEEFEKKKKLDDVSMFIKNAVNTFSQRGDEVIYGSGNYVKGGLLFYEKLRSLLDEKIAHVTQSISRAEKELFEGTNQKTLNNLLERLAAVTRKKNRLGEFVVKLGQSPTVSLVNEIIETASKIQQQKREKYDHLLLQHVYNALFELFDQKQNMLRNAVYKCNKIISEIDREVDKIKRMGRSAFTYNKSKFDKLTEHLMEKIYSQLEVVSTQKVIEQSGLPILESEKLEEKEYLERLLKIIRPDLNQLTRLVDDLFCEDEQVLDYVTSMLDQFFMTVRLDRDRFPTLETSQALFVMCTKRFYDKYRDDLFEGYSHIETENPFNVIVTKHEEGFPFIAISYLHRINEEFKELRAHGRSSFGHIMGNLDNTLPLLDA